jgi:excisionase family DNA binding protein
MKGPRCVQDRGNACESPTCAGAKGVTENLLAALYQVAQEAPLEDLPRFVGALAEVQTRLQLRLATLANAGTGNREEDRLLTLPHVADVLGISEEHARELGRRGKLPTVRVGERYIRVRPEALHAWIEAREEKPLANRLSMMLTSMCGGKERARGTKAARAQANRVRQAGRRSSHHGQPVGTRPGAYHSPDGQARRVAPGDEGQEA